MPGEWGGFETILFIRFSWKITLTIIQPGWDMAYFHRCTVPNSILVIVYNGSTHYMPTGISILISISLYLISQIRTKVKPFIPLIVNLNTMSRNRLVRVFFAISSKYVLR